jgi:hypothetical protein
LVIAIHTSRIGKRAGVRLRTIHALFQAKMA